MFWSNKTSLSVGFVFFTINVLFGGWIARIPEVKADLDMSEAELGLALLGLPVGSLAGAFYASWQLRRQPLGKFTFYMTVGLCVAIILPALAAFPLILSVALISIGFLSSATDVGMNAAAAQVEKKYNILIMSACHGMFSLGGVVGAILGGITASLGIPLWLYLGILGLVMLVLNTLLSPVLFTVPNPEQQDQGFSLPPRALWGLALIGFCVMLGEGAVADWSAIFLQEIRHSSPFLAAMGFAAFSFFMALGRFVGDALTVRFGHRMLTVLGSLLGSVGLLMAISIPGSWSGILGFALTGLGFSVVVPLLFGQAARLQPDAPGDSIAGIASSGIFGFMIGPPAIGFIAEAYGLSIGLLTAALLGILATVVAILNRPGVLTT